MSIYKQGMARNWEKPAVYKIIPQGMWWATYRDQHGKYHTDCFFSHGEAFRQAVRYAKGEE